MLEAVRCLRPPPVKVTEDTQVAVGVGHPPGIVQALIQLEAALDIAGDLSQVALLPEHAAYSIIKAGERHRILAGFLVQIQRGGTRQRRRLFQFLWRKRTKISRSMSSHHRCGCSREAAAPGMLCPASRWSAASSSPPAPSHPPAL